MKTVIPYAAARQPLPGRVASLDVERPRNWLALGLLLAAWNAAHDDARSIVRPDTLRNYDAVSVRALARHSGKLG